MKQAKYSFFKRLQEVTTPGQFCCLVLTCILMGYLPTLIKGTYTYTRYRKLERPDYPTEQLSDFWMAVPCAIIIRLLKVACSYFSEGFFRQKLSVKYSGEDLEGKIRKCTKGIFKVIYFSFTFLFGLQQVLWKTDYAPPILFGDGLEYTLFGNWPFTRMPDMLKFYYMLSFGYYLEDGLMLFFQTPNYDFWEMILHHVITCMLIFSSYMSGFWNIGIYILVQMDVEDIFIGLVRAVMDFSSVLTCAVVYLGIMSTWVYFRFIAFVKLTFWDFTLDTRLSIDGYSESVVVINFLLATLLALNVYWFILLLMMGFRLAFKGQKHDLQMVVTKKEVEQ